MRFKDFLLEHDSDTGSHWFYGSVLLPSDAFDWPQAYPEPSEVKFLLARWKLEKKLGRKFHNLDLPTIEKQKFTSIYSNTMPAASGRSWKHKPDRQDNLKIDRDAPMEIHGIRKRADVVNVLDQPNPMIDKKAELNKLFGKFEPKYYELPKDFDKKWRN